MTQRENNDICVIRDTTRGRLRVDQPLFPGFIPSPVGKSFADSILASPIFFKGVEMIGGSLQEKKKHIFFV